MSEQATAGLVNDVTNDSAAQTSQRYSDAGINASRGLLREANGADTYNQNLGFGDSAMSKAIKNKYAGQVSRGEQHLVNTMNQAGQDDYLKKLQVTSQAAAEEHQLNLQKEILRQKQSQARRAQRGMVVGQVLGITGAIVGGVLGGAGTFGAGAGVGAMAGYGAGTSAGNAIGSM